MSSCTPKKIGVAKGAITLTTFKHGVRSMLIEAAVLMALVLMTGVPVQAASDLTLASDVSFVDDSSPNFPIAGKHLDDAIIAGDRPTLIFFGTAHCWNTAREAERLVTLYPLYRDQVHFVVVDLNHASPAQERLANNYYPGYIPTLAIFDKSGRLVYDRAGETAAKRGDTRHLRELIESALR
jgi:hypothetical protein